MFFKDAILSTYLLKASFTPLRTTNFSKVAQWLALGILLVGCQHESYRYLGQTPPADQPEVFAPGIISLPNRNEEVITFSPDGQEIYYSVEFYPEPKPSFTLVMRHGNGVWSKPDTASFSVGRRTSEPHIALNGTRIYYFANGVENQKGILDLCYSEKLGDTWGEPMSLPSPPNLVSPGYALHPCVVADTSVYFSNSTGEICRSQYRNGAYQPVEILPSPINYLNQSDAACWGDAYVSPEEEFMIFRSNRPGGFGGSDLYITFRTEQNKWSNPMNLGSKINTLSDELGGDITPDGNYLTFGRDGDIYWVSAGFIDRKRKEFLK